MHPLKQFKSLIHVLELNYSCFIIIPSWFWNTTIPATISPGPQTPFLSTYLVTRTTCSDKNNIHTTVIRSAIELNWFDRCKGM